MYFRNNDVFPRRSDHYHWMFGVSNALQLTSAYRYTKIRKGS